MRRDLRGLSAPRREAARWSSAWLAAPGALLALGLFVAAACGEETVPLETLCDPGTNIFCRCPGGEPGTKLCNDAGDAFGECDNCREREDPTGGSGGSTSSGGGGGNPDGAPFLRPCGLDSECQSGLCEFGYCTRNCVKVSDCEYPASECVKRAGVQVCMPVCKTALDCEAFGAPPSQCGFTTAVDNWGVTVCSNFGAEHRLMPAGTDCAPFDHEQCNLGYTARERVCGAEGVCEVGCFTKADCAASKSCSSSGSTLGKCN